MIRVVPIVMMGLSWAEVDAGQQSDWGVIDAEGWLLGHWSTEAEADDHARELNG